MIKPQVIIVENDEAKINLELQQLAGEGNHILEIKTIQGGEFVSKEWVVYDEVLIIYEP